MSFLSPFFNLNDTQERGKTKVCVGAEQGNNFAKHVADDFNPIHDTDSKRFCVPGDLLFAIALDLYGVHESMEFSFQELIKAETCLAYPQLEESEAHSIEVLSDRDKAVLGIKFSGAVTNSDSKLEQLVRNYVVFSGQNFPGILVPLMKSHDVMINPARPLVIYESMSLDFDSLNFTDLHIELAQTSLSVAGKRGNAELHFSLFDGDTQIGKGLKKLVLSGLRQYEQGAIDLMCQQYSESKRKNGL